MMKSSVKKLIISIGVLLALSACGTAKTQTVVVDQNGNIIETKSNFQGLVFVEDLPIDGLVDGQVLQDTRTGCKYGMYGSKMFAIYNADGQVDGCKNLTKNKQENVK